MDGGGEDPCGSLFEGMVLFSPSDISPSGPSPAQTPTPPPLPPSVEEETAPPLPATASPTVAALSQPLDEDLFSDLTLQSPLDPPLAMPPTSSANTLSRQISRKKKRGAVRIGYARDYAPAADEAPSPSHDPLPKPSSSSPPHPSADAAIVLDTRRLVEEHPPLDNTNANSHPLPLSPVEAAESSRRPGSPDESREGRDVDDGSCSRAILEPDEDHRTEFDNELADFPTKEDSFNSIEGKLELVRAQISKNLAKIREMAASVSVERKELVRRRRKAAENVNLVTSRYMELEKQLEEACETEDFERAESVSDSLAAAESENHALINALKEAETDCDAVDAKMQEVLELQIVAEEEGAALLEQFAKDAAVSAEIVYKTAEEDFSSRIAEWQSSMELLEIKKQQTLIESHLIGEARAGLEHSIEHLVEDDQREKDMLKREQDILRKELEELLEKVRIKEAEIAKNVSQIQEVEGRISNVVSDFVDAQSRINVKYDELQLALSKVESECELLLMGKKEIDEALYLAEEKRSKLRELASVSGDEARISQNLVGLRKSLASCILKSREDKVSLAQAEEKILEDIQNVRQQVSAARTSLQELSSTRASIQEEIATFKQRISFIDKRGPELEAEKKVAAAARNFKEAGRVAAEAKALSAERESLQNRMDKAVSDLERLEKEIKDTVDRIHESEVSVLSKEKEAATAGYERLHLVIAATRAERSAALELGDFEEADILLQEAIAAESRARELQEAYSFDSKEHGKTLDQVISIALITNVAGQHLAEMASSFNLASASQNQA